MIIYHNGIIEPYQVPELFNVQSLVGFEARYHVEKNNHTHAEQCVDDMLSLP